MQGMTLIISVAGKKELTKDNEGIEEGRWEKIERSFLFTTVATSSVTISLFLSWRSLSLSRPLSPETPIQEERGGRGRGRVRREGGREE